jgi:hypothetical protein
MPLAPPGSTSSVRPRSAWPAATSSRAPDTRRGFSVSCRVYPSEHGCCGEPQEAWIREAVADASGELSS